MWPGLEHTERQRGKYIRSMNKSPELVSEASCNLELKPGTAVAAETLSSFPQRPEGN